MEAAEILNFEIRSERQCSILRIKNPHTLTTINCMSLGVVFNQSIDQSLGFEFLN